MSSNEAIDNAAIVPIERLAGVVPRRSSGGSCAGLVWLAATDASKSPDISIQMQSAFEKVDRLPQELGSRRENMISVTMYLTEEGYRGVLNGFWNDWIGPDQRNWPQRCCVVVELSPKTLFEITVVAAVG